MRCATVITAVVALLICGPANAAVLCARKKGAVVLRDTACKKRETLIDPLTLRGPAGSPAGPALVGYAEVPNFGGNVTVLDVPGFGRVSVSDGGCVTLPAAQGIAVAYTDTTGVDQDVFTFSFNPSQGPDTMSGYAVALPGVETGLRQLGVTGAVLAHIRPQGGTSEALITVFGAAGGAAGDVCRVSAQALVSGGN